MPESFETEVLKNLVWFCLGEDDVVLVDGREGLVDGTLALRPDGLRLLSDHDLDEKFQE